MAAGSLLFEHPQIDRLFDIRQVGWIHASLLVNGRNYYDALVFAAEQLSQAAEAEGVKIVDDKHARAVSAGGMGSERFHTVLRQYNLLKPAIG